MLSKKPSNNETVTPAATSITNTGLPETSPLGAPDAEITETLVLPVGDSVSGGLHKDDTSEHVGGALQPDAFLIDTVGEAAGISEVQHGNRRHTAADLVAAGSMAHTEQLVHVTASPAGKYTFRGLGAVHLMNLTDEAVSEALIAQDSKTCGAIGEGDGVGIVSGRLDPTYDTMGFGSTYSGFGHQVLLVGLSARYRSDMTPVPLSLQ